MNPTWESTYGAEVHQQALLSENEALRKWLRQSSMSLERGVRGAEMLMVERDTAKREKEVAEAKKERAVSERDKLSQENIVNKQKVLITEDNMQTIVGHVSYMAGQCKKFRNELESQVVSQGTIIRMDSALNEPFTAQNFNCAQTRRDPYEAASHSLLSLHQEVSNLLVAVRQLVAGKVTVQLEEENRPVLSFSARPTVRRTTDHGLKPPPHLGTATLAELLKEGSPKSWETAAVRSPPEPAVTPPTLRRNEEVEELLRDARALKAENDTLHSALYLAHGRDDEMAKMSAKVSMLEDKLRSLDAQKQPALARHNSMSPPRPMRSQRPVGII